MTVAAPASSPSSATRAVVLLARTSGLLSRRLGRGQGGTLPGRIVLALRPQALRELSAGRRVVLVSGTNGKSTTTSLLSAALEEQGPVATSRDGSNLMPGLVGVLMAAAPAATAVLEVDEMVLPAALLATDAAVVVLLNLSRDQMDRVQEVASHVDRWSTALRRSPQVHVVANSDDPLVVAAVLAADVGPERQTWVAAGSPWRGDASLCPRCAGGWEPAADPWRCSSCGLTPPPASWRLTGAGELEDAAGSPTRLDLALPGRATTANAAMAVGAADHLGVPVEAALARMRTVRSVDGRYLRLLVGGRRVRLLLAKNPAGWLEILEQLAASPGDAIALGVNARTADGTDPSWLWDVPFEQLAGRRVVVFGRRGRDLSTRLHYAEVEHELVADVAAALELVPDLDLTVAANYTAFVDARSHLLAVGRPAEV